MECSSAGEAHSLSITRASLGEQVTSSLSSNKELKSHRLQLCCIAQDAFTTRGASRRPPNSTCRQQRSHRSRWQLNQRLRRCDALYPERVGSVWAVCAADTRGNCCTGKRALPGRGRRGWSGAGGCQKTLQPSPPRPCCWCHTEPALGPCFPYIREIWNSATTLAPNLEIKYQRNC